MPHKPVLQALVLADHVYVDAETGKKIIAGTFNELHAAEFPTQFAHVTFAYLCLTDLRGEAELEPVEELCVLGLESSVNRLIRRVEIDFWHGVTSSQR